MDKKEAIFLSTLDLIQEKGFHGTPMSLVAKHANISVGTIYHYFESKEVLIMELFTYCRGRLMKYLFEETDEETYSEDTFKTVWKRFVSFYAQHVNFFRFMDQYYSSPFHEIEHKCKKNCKTKDTLKFIERGRDAGVLKNIDLQLLKSLYIGTAVSFVKAINIGKVNLQSKQTEEMADIVWNSIKAD